MIVEGFIPGASDLPNCFMQKRMKGLKDLLVQLRCVASYTGASRVLFIFKKMMHLFEKGQHFKVWAMYPSMVELIAEFVQTLMIDYITYYESHDDQDSLLKPEDFSNIRLLVPQHPDYKVCEKEGQFYCLRTRPQLQPFRARQEEKKKVHISVHHKNLTLSDIMYIDR